MYSHDKFKVRQPISYPPVPSEHFINGGIMVGQLIVIQGCFPPTSSLLNIDLKPQMGPKADITFHMSIRFNGNVVVRNTRQDGIWGPEERAGEMPFQQHKAFQIMILVQQQSYKIAINGKHFTEYMHRRPFQEISVIGFVGECTIQSVSFQVDPTTVKQMLGLPTDLPPPPPYSPTPTVSAPISNPFVPFSGPITGGLYPGKTIIVQGMVNSHPSRFHINLVQDADIAFHFNPRFDRNYVVCNTLVNGKWGSEERHTKGFPFAPGKLFDIKIICESDCYKVAVNEEHFCEYYHRLKQLNSIQGLQVRGDCQLSQILVQ